MTLKREKTETGYLDVLRVYAVTAVVVFHVFAFILKSFGEIISRKEYFISVMLVNIWLWHVPSFVMISGVIFLNTVKEITVKQLLKKYIFRIVLALFIFGVPFAFMEILFDAGFQFKTGQIGMAILNVFQGKLWDHMWYLYMIMGLYLMLPLLKTFVSNTNRRTMEYVILVLFIFTSIIPTVQNIFQIKIGFYLPVNSVFVLYLLMGHYIHHYNITIKNGVLFGIGIFYIVYIAAMQLLAGNIIGLYGNISPLVVMITAAVFCFIRQNIKGGKVYRLVSPYVFGIYLIHQFFLNFFYKFMKFTPERYPLVMIVIIITSLTIILSFSFSYGFRKIKIIKKYVL